jgi:hypothetical protein
MKVKGMVPMGVALSALALGVTLWANEGGGAPTQRCMPLTSIENGVMNCDVIVTTRVRGQRGFNYTLQTVTEIGPSTLSVPNSKALLTVGKTVPLEIRVVEGMVTEVKPGSTKAGTAPITRCGKVYRSTNGNGLWYFTWIEETTPEQTVDIPKTAEGYEVLEGSNEVNVTIQTVKGIRSVVSLSRAQSCPK